MPTLSAPNVSTYRTTTPNEFVNVICTGQNDSMVVSWVGPGGISGQRTVRNTSAAGEEVGPFPNDTTVTFASGSGTPSFTAPAYGEPLQALVSGAGNALLSPQAMYRLRRHAHEQLAQAGGDCAV